MIPNQHELLPIFLMNEINGTTIVRNSILFTGPRTAVLGLIPCSPYTIVFGSIVRFIFLPASLLQETCLSRCEAQEVWETWRWSWESMGNESCTKVVINLVEVLNAEAKVPISKKLCIPNRNCWKILGPAFFPLILLLYLEYRNLCFISTPRAPPPFMRVVIDHFFVFSALTWGSLYLLFSCLVSWISSDLCSIDLLIRGILSSC